MLIIDDHELLSSALEVAFTADGRIRVVGRATSIGDGLSQARSLHPEVILTDRRLPDGDVDQHVEALLTASPGARVLIMTGWPTDRSTLAALDAGVHGIISKSQPVERIIDAVDRVACGDLVLPPDVTRLLLNRSGGRRTGRRDAMSTRELDVLEALARGRSTSEAATELCMSENTLRNHLSRAMLKLGAHDRLGAVSEAIRLGLVSPAYPAAARSLA